MKTTPVRQVRYAPAAVRVDRRSDGATLLTSPEPLEPYPRCLTERFAHWAQTVPDRDFIAQRDSRGDWRRLTYGAAFERMRAIAQALLARDLGPDRPLAMLSDNDIEQALLALAAMHVGVPFVPISSAYALASRDFGKLRYVCSLLTPGLVFAAEGERFAAAIDAVVPRDTEIVLGTGTIARRTSMPFAALESGAATQAVDRAHARVGPDTIAKFLLTSGSTGDPKAVVNTQRMLCANQQMILQTLPLLADPPPVLVDWLPWNHTFGGNHNFGLVIYSGGTLYIDDGKPVPGLFERTVRNLREIAPTAYFNVPRGFEELVPYLRREPELRERFFSRVGMMFYAGAGLAQPVWDALDELALQTCGERILWVTGLGATETAPSVTFTSGDGVRSGMIGLPVPGVGVKLVPVDDKTEIRVRGPSVTPGYWRQGALTAAAFDGEGFYRLGDAVKWVDAADPRQGLVFDGRIAEDFKLATGTWVSVGPLRAKLIAAGAPYVQDVVIVGLNRDEVTALIFPRLDRCRALCPELPTDAAASAVLAHPAVRAWCRALLEALGREATGSSTRVVRALLLDVPPSIDAHEVTDKGSINQRAVLTNRPALVEALYAIPVPAQVIEAGPAPRDSRRE